jgi:hypothetical protein
VAASFKAGEPLAADIQGADTEGGERSLPAGEAIFSSDEAREAAGGPGRARSVRAVLAAHPGKIFVLPSGRRIRIDTLLEHLAETESRGEWAEAACEVCFAETIEPWAMPSSAPCWERMRGPLWHLWIPDTGAGSRKLLGLIVPDQRVSHRAAEREPLFAAVWPEFPREPDGEAAAPFAPAGAPSDEIELSDLVVEGEYHPRMKETDPAIRALTPPAGEGWQPRWWKLGNRPLWQYGWWR